MNIIFIQIKYFVLLSRPQLFKTLTTFFRRQIFLWFSIFFSLSSFPSFQSVVLFPVLPDISRSPPFIFTFYLLSHIRDTCLCAIGKISLLLLLLILLPLTSLSLVLFTLDMSYEVMSLPTVRKFFSLLHERNRSSSCLASRFLATSYARASVVTTRPSGVRRGKKLRARHC